MAPKQAQRGRKLSPRQMMLAPAGMEAWGYSDDVRFVKAATLTFDTGVLEER